MASTDDLQALADFGIFNDDGVSRLATLIRNVQALTGGAAAPSTGKRRGRPPAAAKPTNGATRQRAARGSFSPTKEELAKMKTTMTAKEIADKHGVSVATVNLRLKKLGLTTPRKGAAKKK